MQTDSFVAFREWLLANDYTSASAYQMETLARGLHRHGAKLSASESLEKALGAYASSTHKHRRSAWRAYVRFSSGADPKAPVPLTRKAQHKGQPIEYDGVEYKSLTALALAHNIRPSAFFNRRARGEDLKTALRPLEKTGRPKQTL